jgi:SAM-dependent methyltransferase
MKKTESRSTTPPLWSAVDLTQGFFLSHALLTLERLGILESLREPLTAGDVAAKHQVNEEVLEATLWMLAAKTSVVRYRSGKYQTTSAFDPQACFYLLQYAGSYGANAHQLAKILRKPSAGRYLVDREQHRRAYEQIQTSGNDPLARMVLQLGFNRVLDLGCGTANMLLYLASHRKDFIGWGMDNSPQMCAAARRRVAATRNGRRIKILHADSRALKSAISAPIFEQVEAITAKGVANEFFAEGISEAVAWLANIKALFPGRTLLIADYYGHGFKKKPGRVVRLLDYVQVISWQGVPPPDVAGWETVYRAAKCKLIQTVEHLPTFIHVLKL